MVGSWSQLSIGYPLRWSVGRRMRARWFDWRSNPVGSGAVCCALSIVSDGGGGRGTTPGRRRRVYDGDVEVVGSRPMGGEAHPRKSQCLLLSPSCPPTSLDRFFHLRPAPTPAARSGRNLCRCAVRAIAPFRAHPSILFGKYFSIATWRKSFAYFTNYALLVRNTL